MNKGTQTTDTLDLLNDIITYINKQTAKVNALDCDEETQESIKRSLKALAIDLEIEKKYLHKNI